MDAALRWRTVQTEEKFVKCDDRENAPAATQTLVSSAEVERAHKTLQTEHATTKCTSHSEGQKMRCAPDRKSLMSNEKQKNHNMQH